jgi:hypothetical protein
MISRPLAVLPAWASAALISSVAERNGEKRNAAVSMWLTPSPTARRGTPTACIASSPLARFFAALMRKQQAISRDAASG